MNDAPRNGKVVWAALCLAVTLAITFAGGWVVALHRRMDTIEGQIVGISTTQIHQGERLARIEALAERNDSRLDRVEGRGR